MTYKQMRNQPNVPQYHAILQTPLERETQGVVALSNGMNVSVWQQSSNRTEGLLAFM